MSPLHTDNQEEKDGDNRKANKNLKTYSERYKRGRRRENYRNQFETTSHPSAGNPSWHFSPLSAWVVFPDPVSPMRTELWCSWTWSQKLRLSPMLTAHWLIFCGILLSLWLWFSVLDVDMVGWTLLLHHWFWQALYFWMTTFESISEEHLWDPLSPNDLGRDEDTRSLPVSALTKPLT